MKRERFNNNWHDYWTYCNMFKEFNMNSLSKSYNFGYHSTDDRLKGNINWNGPTSGPFQML